MGCKVRVEIKNNRIFNMILSHNPKHLKFIKSFFNKVTRTDKNRKVRQSSLMSRCRHREIVIFFFFFLFCLTHILTFNILFFQFRGRLSCLPFRCPPLLPSVVFLPLSISLTEPLKVNHSFVLHHLN